jgi:hypothetical protein
MSAAAKPGELTESEGRITNGVPIVCRSVGSTAAGSGMTNCTEGTRMAPEPQPKIASSLTEDEVAQLTHVLTHTTPAERILLVEEMRLVFGTEHLRRGRDLKWRMERNDDGSEKRPVNWRSE